MVCLSVLKGLIEAFSVALLVAILVASVELDWRGLGVSRVVPFVQVRLFAQSLILANMWIMPCQEKCSLATAC